jgi:transaldolase / glucose-6-phosphate isomerase
MPVTSNDARGREAKAAGRGENPLLLVQQYGQSLWLDYIRRQLLTSGELQRLIREDGLRGVTSNPTIFEKAIGGGTDYDGALAAMISAGEHDPKALYENIAIEDIQEAADTLRGVYEGTDRLDGYVSFEVSPHLAHDTEGTVAEARRLWSRVGRENLMIKVPGTPEGLPAFRQLISEGINVNVTLLFAREVYQHVSEAYMYGLEDFAAAGGDLAQVASVASFFVSRIDTAVDQRVSGRLAAKPAPDLEEKLRRLMGKVAIANAKLAYEGFRKIHQTSRWRTLELRGAHLQRLLWASTGTKNPAYSDLLYVDELIGPETVNTLPLATLEAFRDHGHPRSSLVEAIDAAGETLNTLDQVGISLKEITDQLLKEGVQSFADSYDALLTTIRAKI